MKTKHPSVLILLMTIIVLMAVIVIKRKPGRPDDHKVLTISTSTIPNSITNNLSTQEIVITATNYDSPSNTGINFDSVTLVSFLTTNWAILRDDPSLEVGLVKSNVFYRIVIAGESPRLFIKDSTIVGTLLPRPTQHSYVNYTNMVFPGHFSPVVWPNDSVEDPVSNLKSNAVYP